MAGLPTEFTVAALQAKVQNVSSAPVHKASFRRVLRQYNVLVGTKKFTEGVRGRPAELMRWNRKLSKGAQERVAYLFAQWKYA